METRIKNYFIKKYTSGTKHSRLPIFEKISIPERTFTLDELFIIAGIILLHEYSDNGSLTKFNIETKSISKIRRDYEFDVYFIELVISEEDFKNEKLITISRELRNYLKSIQYDEKFSSQIFIIEKVTIFQELADKHLISKLLLTEICTSEKIKEIMFYLIDF